jgi:peroxiredoxin
MRAAGIARRPMRRIGANKRMTFAFDRDGSVLAVIKSAFNMKDHADKAAVVLQSSKSMKRAMRLAQTADLRERLAALCK